MFSVIVLIHEWGHFKAARIFGVKVEEFWLGIPPRAKKLFVDKTWTLFSLNWLPLGGFVKLTWESPNRFLLYNENKKIYDNDSLEKAIKEWKNIFDKFSKKLTKLEKEEILKLLEENKASYNMMNKAAWKQSIIVLAWIFMNFVLAFFIFFILFLVWVKPIWINNKIETNLDLKLIPTIEQALEREILKKSDGIIISPINWSLLLEKWLKPWDIILKVKNKSIQTPKDFQNIIQKSASKEIILNWYSENNSWKKEFFTKKVLVPETGKIWTYISENITLNKDFKYQFWVIESAQNAFLETKNQVILTFKWLWILAEKIFNPKDKKERQEAIKQVSWPIWIVDFVSSSISAGVVFLLVISAIISINLWVFNLLPIPALDWWRFIFIIINSSLEKLFSKKILSTNLESIIHLSFFVILIALSLIIWYNDITKILNK